MEQLLNDLINGNLKEAKARAKRIPRYLIERHFQSEGGMRFRKANKAAGYLKGENSFQDYADA